MRSVLRCALLCATLLIGLMVNPGPGSATTAPEAGEATATTAADPTSTDTGAATPSDPATTTQQQVRYRYVHDRDRRHVHCKRVKRVKRYGEVRRVCVKRRVHDVCPRRAHRHRTLDGLHRRKRCVKQVAVVDGTVTTPGTGTGTPTGTVKHTHYGVSYGERLSWMDQATLDATLDDAVALGVKWIRVDMAWKSIERNFRGDWHWSAMDRVVNAAKARNLEILPILAYTPPWAKRSGCTAFGCPPANPDDFVNFAKVAVARYKDRIKVWEVWNEPNLDGFWTNPSIDGYAELLKRTAPAIHAVDPEAKVMFGGIAALERNDWWVIPPREFLDGVCKRGACVDVDAVSYHPYTFPFLASTITPWESPWAKIDQTPVSIRSVMNAHGMHDDTIWITEYGAPTEGPGQINGDGLVENVTSATDHVTEAWQAAIADNVVRTAATNPNVHALFWYTNQDIHWQTGAERAFGLRRIDGSKKPSWDAYGAAVKAMYAAVPTS